jgi:hypothetical protein
MAANLARVEEHASPLILNQATEPATAATSCSGLCIRWSRRGERALTRWEARHWDWGSAECSCRSVLTTLTQR